MNLCLGTESGTKILYIEFVQVEFDNVSGTSLNKQESHSPDITPGLQVKFTLEFQLTLERPELLMIKTRIM